MPDKIHCLENKLILKPDEFTSRKSFFDYAWKIGAIAASTHIGWEPISENSIRWPRIREVTFWDTPDFQLRKHNFILRRRIPYQDGFPLAEPEIALKYRVPNMDLAAYVDMTPNLPKESYYIKFEAETFPLKDHLGGMRFIFSHDVRTTLGALRPGALTSTDVLMTTFPVLTPLNLGPRLTLVNKLIVEEILQDLGTLDFGQGDIADATICLWRERGMQIPLCAEFAFEIRVAYMHELKAKAVEKCERFFIAMQTHSDLMLGVTKTELIYRGI